MSAWAWAVSRIMDALEMTPAASIDLAQRQRRLGRRRAGSPHRADDTAGIRLRRRGVLARLGRPVRGGE